MILKKLARWILKDEIKKLQEDYEIERTNLRHAESEVRRLFDEKLNLAERYDNDRKKYLDDYGKLQDDYNFLKGDLTIMQQYYRLLGEATAEEKTKVMIDLRVHELERENLKLQRDSANWETICKLAAATHGASYYSLPVGISLYSPFYRP